MSSEKFIKNNLALVTLIAASLVVFISLSVRQVFGMFFMDFNADLGIEITASHNDKRYNGYKLITKLGCLLYTSPSPRD